MCVADTIYNGIDSGCSIFIKTYRSFILLNLIAYIIYFIVLGSSVNYNFKRSRCALCKSGSIHGSIEVNFSVISSVSFGIFCEGYTDLVFILVIGSFGHDFFYAILVFSFDFESCFRCLQFRREYDRDIVAFLYIFDFFFVYSGFKGYFFRITRQSTAFPNRGAVYIQVNIF